MAKKSEKKISISELDNVIKEMENETVVEWNGLELKIRHTISIQEMFDLVNEVVDLVIDDDYGYAPEFELFAFKSGVVEKYTNIRLPDNLAHRAEIIYKTGIMEFISEYINAEQFADIVHGIKQKIDFMLNSRISMVSKKLDEVMDTAEAMSQQMETIFSEISPKELVDFTRAAMDNHIDEEKLVSAYIANTRSEESTNEEDKVSE